MSKFVPKGCKSMLDLGCGEMHIKKYISSDITYYGCDYKKRDSETIVCDLSKNQFPNIIVDIIYISGVFEYLSNWKEVFEKCFTHCNQIILSYSTTELAITRDPIWVNAISRNEIIQEALSHGFILADTDVYNSSEIFNLIKSE